MRPRNMKATTERVHGRIAEHYDMSGSDVVELCEIAQKDVYEAITRAFEYGYVLGHRATKAGKYSENSREA